MSGYLEVNGVHTWFQDRGSGEAVVLLHGGLVDGRDFDGNLAALDQTHRVLIPDRRAHGRSHDVGGRLDLATMAADAAAFIESVGQWAVALVGYSAGAMVAIRVAVAHPHLVSKLVLVSGAFDNDGMLFGPSMEEPPLRPLVDAHDEVTPHGPGHFMSVLPRIVDSALHDPPLTVPEVSSVACPTLVMCADDDLVVLEHTLVMYRAIAESQLAVVPGTSHLLLHEKADLCTQLVRDFLTSPWTQTLMPIRRAAVPSVDREGCRFVGGQMIHGCS